MKLKILATIVFLMIVISLIPSGTVHAVVSMSPSQGFVGVEVTIDDLPEGVSYKISWDGSAVAQGIVGVTKKGFFLVPEACSGEHSILVESPSGTQVFSGKFTVLPNIAIDPKTGIVGTTITVAGHGFGINEKNIAVTYDGVNVKSGISADETGYWSISFDAPASTRGSHEIDASGDITKATDIKNQVFTISPTVKIEPIAGGVGTLVTVTATGFASAETGIKVLYSGEAVRSDITAEVNGSWATSFAIPSSTRGSHIVDVSGNTTPASDIADMVFTVAPAVVISPNTGYVEDIIKISGSGYGNNETGIDVSFDGQTIERGIIADASGFWSTSLKVPPSVNGPHTITAVGKITPSSEITPATFTTQAQIIAVPKSGNVNDQIRVTGTGFSGNKDFNISFETTSVANGTTTEFGSLSATFQAPGGRSGPCNIVITDTKNVTASTTFTIETTPPEVPKISSPKDGATVGFIGDTKVTFDWSDVADPSGVFYSLEVSDQPSFVKKIVSQTKLTESKYTLTEAESLPNGEYYWHVRAIDGAGNASDWTTAYIVKVGFMTTSTLMYIGIGLVILIIILVIFRGRNKKKRPKRDWE